VFDPFVETDVHPLIADPPAKNVTAPATFDVALSVAA
jgi:hypothetical protein